MSYQAVKESYAAEIADIKGAGLWKTERVITSDQKNSITLAGGRERGQHVRKQLPRSCE